MTLSSVVSADVAAAHMTRTREDSAFPVPDSSFANESAICSSVGVVSCTTLSIAAANAPGATATSFPPFPFPPAPPPPLPRSCTVISPKVRDVSWVVRHLSDTSRPSSSRSAIAGAARMSSVSVAPTSRK